MARSPQAKGQASDLVLERLNKLHPKIIDLSLDRTWRLLERLGHPERRLPPVIHVAGTNGKGSVIAYLRAMLEAAGYRVHVYISPHLVRFHERIRLAGKLIEEQALLEVLKECEAINGADAITFFEITTCAAFLEFARVPADILLLETGLGGRLDSTNVIEEPLATVLMPISFDHMQHLGDTLAKIAFEKAGIIKHGVPIIVAPQPPEAEKVFKEKARELKAPLIRFGREWQIEAAGDGMQFTDRAGTRLLPRPALPGDHQIPNAGAALATLPFLTGLRVDEAAQAAGLRQVEWPARLQRLTRGPLAQKLPRGWELWLDGGHNAAAGEVLADFARHWREGIVGHRPLHLIFGMLNTKEPVAFLKPLAPYTRDLKAVRIEGDHASLPAEEAAAAARAAGIEAETAASLDAAIERIVTNNEIPSRVLICGSLYLAGVVLAENG
ncbi:MAG TPA: folylpolyglutamate synthase/dihydrofolate synthase family protein [Candidatus Polarisedimenticolia bacterium]|nr:folylpolyglutamate synthase/dihydrofolate synthase family protein [Candidatus Polarisedimenticolia bacterium]